MDRRAAIEVLSARPDRTTLLTDFDGTLAEVVPDPAAAVPIAGATEVLEALRAAGFLVNVISGRPVGFLAEHLPASLDLSGLYGLEWRRDGMIGEHPGAHEWASVVRGSVAEARRELPGILVEPKRLTLTLHYRQCPERRPEVERFAQREASRSGLEARPAKMSVELHPPIAADKGTAISELLAEAGAVDAAAFLGDDVGDLAAFAALDRLAAGGMQTVKVGVETSETPAELLAVTDLAVAGPAGAVAFLAELARAASAG